MLKVLKIINTLQQTSDVLVFVICYRL